MTSDRICNPFAVLATKEYQLPLSVGVSNIFADDSYLLPLETMLLKATTAKVPGQSKQDDFKKFTKFSK